jgi:SAM-dependent methyltransferase
MIKTLNDLIPDAAGIYQVAIMQPRAESVYAQVCGRRIRIKNADMIQFEKYTGTQVFHENIPLQDVLVKISEFAAGGKFAKIRIRSDDAEYTITITKDGELKTDKKEIKAGGTAAGTHNRVKKYIIKENMPVKPLIDLGIFTDEGKIINAKYDKFRQINRFLEIINDTLVFFPDKKIKILDFGCGKSQLTFVVYYFLKEMLNYDAHIVGLDLKKGVIAKCNKIAEKYGYSSLRFEDGTIGDFVPSGDIDLVMSLHACDTATDLVLFKAIKHNAKVILSVPCCQHELNKQMRGNEYAILTRYGIVQERIAALFTDSIRANLLEAAGYKTQMLEFVDFDNTPKNILIRAVKATIPAEAKTKALAEVHALMRQFNLSPELYKLLRDHAMLESAEVIPEDPAQPAPVPKQLRSAEKNLPTA